MRYLLTVSYDGLDFCGYQIQPSVRTVQEVIENALETVLGERAMTSASGRTDSGVHAYGQVVHFDTDRELEHLRLQRSLNALLPHDVKVTHVDDAHGRHARYDAVHKTYEYRLYVSDYDHPLRVGRLHREYHQTSVELMQSASKAFLGEHDFSQFGAKGGSAKTGKRTIYECAVKTEDDKILITVTGNGFLYKMVRNIAGTLVRIGQGALLEADIANALSGQPLPKNVTLPACGLYLMSVKYD